MLATDLNVAVIGAGPYGVAAAAHLRRRALSVTVFGDAMAFWETMPKGMMLRSNWGATSIAERAGDLSLDAYIAATGARVPTPVPIASFVEYGKWVQRCVVPDIDTRYVAHVGRRGERFVIELNDGTTATARRVVIAAGIAAFASRPSTFAALPTELASHTSERHELSAFSGKQLAIVGGGQSALEWARLASAEGADVEVIVRQPRVVWLRWPPVKKRIGALGALLYAPTDVGPLWYSRLVSEPDIFRRLPRAVQDRIAQRSVRPAASHLVRMQFGEQRITLARTVVDAQAIGERVRLTLDDGSVREVDHVMLGTGYRVDLTRYDFIDSEIAKEIATTNDYPILGRGFESSVPGLHFLGAPAAWSFGPIMRFISGSWYGGRALATQLLRTARS